MPLRCVNVAPILASVTKSLYQIVTFPNSKYNIIKHNAAYQNALLQSCTSLSNSSTQVRVFATIQWHYLDKSSISLMFSIYPIELLPTLAHKQMSSHLPKQFHCQVGHVSEKLPLKTPLGILKPRSSKSLLPIKRLLFNLQNYMWLKGQASKEVHILMLSAENLLN